MSQHPPYCCQRCGACIGYIGIWLQKMGLDPHRCRPAPTTAFPRHWRSAAEVFADSDLADTKDEATEVIAAALHAAENRGVERAALMFETGGDEAWNCFPRELAANVRALKHNEPPTLECRP